MWSHRDDDDLLVQDDSISLLLIIVSITYRLPSILPIIMEINSFRWWLWFFILCQTFFCDGNFHLEFRREVTSDANCPIKKMKKFFQNCIIIQPLFKSWDHHTRDKWLNHEERKKLETFSLSLLHLHRIWTMKNIKNMRINEINFFPFRCYSVSSGKRKKIFIFEAFDWHPPICESS